MPELRVRTYTNTDKTIVSTRGAIDLATSPLLEAHLIRLIADDCRHLVVNLSRSAYVDSTGLAALIRAHKAMRRVGGRLAVVGCQPLVARVMLSVGFHHLFPIAERQSSRARRLNQAHPI